MVQDAIKHWNTSVFKAGHVLQRDRWRKPSDGVSWDWNLEDHTYLKAFTQARVSPVFFSRLWRSFQIYSTFSSSLHSCRGVHPSSYCITFVAIPLLLLSSLSICLTMHQISHAAKQGRRKQQTKRCCTYNTAGLSGLQKTHTGYFETQKGRKKLEDYRKRMLFPRTLLVSSNRKSLSDTTFNHILVFSCVQCTQLKVIIGSHHQISMKTMSTAWRGLSFKHKSCLSWKWMTVLFPHKYLCKALS